MKKMKKARICGPFRVIRAAYGVVGAVSLVACRFSRVRLTRVLINVSMSIFAPILFFAEQDNTTDEHGLKSRIY